MIHCLNCHLWAIYNYSGLSWCGVGKKVNRVIEFFHVWATLRNDDTCNSTSSAEKYCRILEISQKPTPSIHCRNTLAKSMNRFKNCRCHFTKIQCKECRIRRDSEDWKQLRISRRSSTASNFAKEYQSHIITWLGLLLVRFVCESVRLLCLDFKRRVVAMATIACLFVHRLQKKLEPTSSQLHGNKWKKYIACCNRDTLWLHCDHGMAISQFLPEFWSFTKELACLQKCSLRVKSQL